MENVNVSELVERLGSDEDAVRKMAVFKLQSNIGDPSFADIFISEGGLAKLKHLAMTTSGNTLAYSLTSFARLLDVDKGWEFVETDLIERIVKLIVTHPLVNILRGAMSILVSIVSHPHSSGRASVPGVFGFQALKPAIAIHSQFLEMLVSRLSSADHALCANSLQLINSLMRDSITNQSEAEWPKFIKQLQDLSVIRAVYVLMQGSALQDLAHPLLEFQSLTKLLLRKWRDVPIELEKTEHRRGLKSIHLASNPERHEKGSSQAEVKKGDSTRRTASKRHNPRKWRRLGFQTENPQSEFKEMGYLGMMDLTDYVGRYQDEFQKLLLEQSAKPAEQRCPISRASLAVTSVLYEHFEVEKSDIDDPKSYLILESGSTFDKLFKPLLLHWPRLHVAGLRAFFRLWKSTGAEHEDFSKIVDLVRILVESVVGGAVRTKEIQDIEEEMVDFECQRLRELQMELLELTYEDAWGQHLQQVREELHHEALQFVKEQRVRCLLQGAWFPLTEASPKGGESNGLSRSNKHDTKRNGENLYRYVQLSHNRRHLHYADFESIDERSTPDLESLSQKIDLGMVSSVVSNVSASPDNSSGSTIKTLPHPSTSSTKITIHGYAQPPNSNPFMSPQASFSQDPQRTISSPENQNEAKSGGNEEIVLLTLYPQSHSVASEWLDGLLMILNQQPITAETNKLINLVSNYGLKIRLLNVRFDETGFIGECPEVPSREGLDEDYYYDIFGAVKPISNESATKRHQELQDDHGALEIVTLNSNVDGVRLYLHIYTVLMAGQPRKRQKRTVYDSEDDDGEYIEPAPSRNSWHETPSSTASSRTQSQSQPSILLQPSGRLSRPSKKTINLLNPPRQSTLSSTSTRASPVSSPKKTRSKAATSPRKSSNKASSESPSKSLRTFFRPATEEERWDRAKKEKATQTGKGNKRLNKSREGGLFKRKVEEVDNEVVEDIIEDEDSDDVEILSQQLRSTSSSQRASSIYHGHLALDRRKESDPIDNTSNGNGVKTSVPNKSIKRFLLPPDQKANLESDAGVRSSTPSFSCSTVPVVTRPWADEFAPTSLDELAVHKRKVADIQKWLTEVFSGRSRRRLLVLKGPAGSGKTTTISLLSKALQYDIVEWKNRSAIQQSAHGYVSNSMQFDDFLGRGDKFNTLQLDSEADNPSTDDLVPAESSRRIMLIEEFPSTLGSNSHALLSFRASLQLYLASAMASRPAFVSQLTSKSDARSSPPIVIIVSENMLGTGDALSENLTVHRLLGAELSNHPATSIIEFNPVAPTIMSKALRLVLKKKELLSKQRIRIPGSDILKRVSEMGDIRNAISALEFMCVRDGEHEGSRVVAADSRLKRPGKIRAPTSASAERESVEFVTQREASLGIFHAVGKVVYNKRDPITTSNTASDDSHHMSRVQNKHNSLISQVSVEDLIDETGTDISTFIAALHENYPLSCAGKDFIDSFESCAEFVSDADILGPGNLWNSRLDRSAGIARTVSRGLGTSVDIIRQDELSFQVAVRGLIFSLPYPVSRQGVDPYKMFYPTSSRLWRQTEEIGELIDIWVRRLANPDNRPSTVTAASSSLHGGESSPHHHFPRCMLSRDEVTLERLPYMSMISKSPPEIAELDKITRFQGNIQRSQDLGDSDLDESLCESDPIQSPFYPILSTRRKSKEHQQQKASSEIPSTQSAEIDVEKLTLSDDDIEDD